MLVKTDREKLVELVRWIMWKADFVKDQPKRQTDALFTIIEECVIVLNDIGEPLEEPREE